MKVMKYVLPVLAVLVVMTGCPTPTDDTDKAVKKPVTGVTVTIDSVSQAEQTIQLEVETEVTLAVTLQPADITGTITWSPLEDTNVSVVPTTTGTAATLKGLAEGGPVTIIVSAQNDDNVSPVTVQFYVEVIPVQPKAISNLIVTDGSTTVNDNDTITLFQNEIKNLLVSLEPKGATGTFTWSPSDSNTSITSTANVAAVKGLVVGGPYTVTVSAANELTDPAIERTFNIIVTERSAPPSAWYNTDIDLIPTSTAAGVGVVYGNGTFVAVGASGTIIYSTDGIDWTAVATKPFTDDIRGIAYGGGKFLVVGNGGQLASSSDGQAWSGMGFPFNQRFCIASDGGQKFAAGGNTGSVFYSTDGGINWTEAMTGMGTGFGVRYLAYGNGRLVAVGYSGTEGPKIAYSTNDGATWTLATVPSPAAANITYFFMRVAYGNGKFILAGGNGYMASSTDGETWAGITSPTGFTSAIDAMAYVNGYFIIGDRTGKMAYSADGDTWTAANAAANFTTSPVHSIAYGADKWIAVSNGGQIGYSDGYVKKPVTGVSVYDGGQLINNETIILFAQGAGKNLTAQLAGADDITGDVTWTLPAGGDTYVSLGATTGSSVTITGIAETTENVTVTVSAENEDNKTPVTVQFFVQVRPQGAANPVTDTKVKDADVVIANNAAITLFNGEERILAVELYPLGVSGTATWTPVDNTTVQVVPVAGGLSATLTGLTNGGPVTITVSAENDDNDTPIVKTFTVTVKTPPGSWTAVAPAPGTANITGVAYGNNKWVAAGYSGKVLHSDNASSWTEVTVDSGVNFRSSIAFDSTNFYAGSTTGKVFISSDGETWTPVQLAATGAIVSSITSADGKLVATNASSGSKMVYSTDSGQTWQEGMIATAGAQWGSAYGNGIWVVVGASGKIQYSTTNLTTWTVAAQPTGHSATYYKIAYGDEKFVAVGQSGQAAYSVNGEDWIAITAAELTGDLLNIVYANGYFVVQKASGDMVYSSNGIEWSAPIESNLGAVSAGNGGIAFGNNTWVAGGNTGKMSVATQP